MRLLAKKTKDDERGPVAAEETKKVEKKPSGKVSLGGKSFPTVLSKLKKWGDYNSFGHPMVAEMIVPMKTPLTVDILNDWGHTLDEMPKHVHTVSTFLKAQREEGREVGLIVDLCNHDCLYRDDIPSNVSYEHIWCVAKEVPGDEHIQNFVSVLESFQARNPTKYAAVHCSYGFNRTGFMICCYLIQKVGLSISEALQKFKDSRNPGIKHEKFKNELRQRYGNLSVDTGSPCSSEERQRMEDSLISLDIENRKDLLRKLELFIGDRAVPLRRGSQDSIPSISSLDSIHSLVGTSDDDDCPPSESGLKASFEPESKREKKKKQARGCVIM